MNSEKQTVPFVRFPLAPYDVPILWVWSPVPERLSVDGRPGRIQDPEYRGHPSWSGRQAFRRDHNVQPERYSLRSSALASGELATRRLSASQSSLAPVR